MKELLVEHLGLNGKTLKRKDISGHRIKQQVLKALKKAAHERNKEEKREDEKLEGIKERKRIKAALKYTMKRNDRPCKDTSKEKEGMRKTSDGEGNKETANIIEDKLMRWKKVVDIYNQYQDEASTAKSNPVDATQVANTEEDETDAAIEGQKVKERTLFTLDREVRTDTHEEKTEGINILELDRSWVLDSVASRNATSETKAEQHKKKFDKIKERVFETAVGETTSKFGVKGLIEKFQDTTIDIYLMPVKDCPSLLSLGSLERKGYTFMWNYGYLPCLVSQRLKVIRVLDIRSNLPMLMKRGVSELRLNEEVIEGLTEIRFVDGQLRILECKDDLPPAEAEEWPCRGRRPKRKIE